MAQIVVPQTVFSYTVKFVCGILEEDTPKMPVLQGKYATDINIYNYSSEKRATIKKKFIPIVINGDIKAREPNQMKVSGEDSIVLGPENATMDDCTHIREILHGSEKLMIGFLEIVSNMELVVTAVYTSSGISGKDTNIHVENIIGRKKI